MSCVSELVLQTSRGCTISVISRGDPVAPHTSIWHVLHEQQLHPYLLQKDHALGPFSVHGFYTSVSTIPNISTKHMVKGGSTPWPPWLLDLTPLDFFMCGHMKNLVYETPVESEEDLA